MKKETLEEVAENYGWRIKRNTFSDAVKANELAESAQQDFIAGAKWQEDRMYNDIEQKWAEYRCYTNNEDAWMFKEWLVEQFKKK
jgi:hypothetical protein